VDAGDLHERDLAGLGVDLDRDAWREAACREDVREEALLLVVKSATFHEKSYLLVFEVEEHVPELEAAALDFPDPPHGRAVHGVVERQRGLLIGFVSHFSSPRRLIGDCVGT
jgi:hypothetical protein